MFLLNSPLCRMDLFLIYQVSDAIGIPWIPVPVQKPLFLHYHNKCLSLVLLSSIYFIEDYTSVKSLVSTLMYHDFNWKVIGNFKMLTFLMGLQGGFTKYTEEFLLGQENVNQRPVLDLQKVFLSPLYVNFGWMMKFMYLFLFKSITLPIFNIFINPKIRNQRLEGILTYLRK